MNDFETFSLFFVAFFPGKYDFVMCGLLNAKIELCENFSNFIMSGILLKKYFLNNHSDDSFFLLH